MVLACPACESPNIYERGTPDRTTEWACVDCGATCAEPVERESKRLHDRLLAHDPEPWPPDAE